ncbi:hypothetical protein O6H91_05G089200 [Diphasiastrum complanatum]|uniref:Uncharacterized protein n=1 Tax=Diphasiastrum complanatum TaxID=34168 RepID=A0ACC2DQR8_DIPCM|nr:hypothetical protein O6H91_Y442700 [Diphasiastrum complanatum]KAJ7556590.1 hypothetical protein O6H91_05G089200 [Diphasiastrum complanatum]
MAAAGMLGSPTSARLHTIGDGDSPSKRQRAKNLPRSCIRCSGNNSESVFGLESVRIGAAGLCAALTVATAWPAFCAPTSSVRLPPISTDPSRCEKAYIGNTIGQANGVADKLLDLRSCDFTNIKDNLKGKTLSAALMADAKFDAADMTEVIMTKAYAVGASFKGTDFTNAILDRVVFDKADLRGVKFKNTVLSGSTFDGANLEDASFEDALLGYVDIQKLCRNPTLPEGSRSDLGCKN